MAQQRLQTLKATRRRWPALLWLCAAAAVVHLLALSGLQWAWPHPEVAPMPAPVMAVRKLPAPLARPVEPVLKTATASPVPAARPAPAAPLRPARRAAPPMPSVIAAEATRTIDAPALPLPALPGPVEPDDDTIPLYRTLTPPPVTLRYQVQHGPLVGSGELRWRPTANGYDLTLNIDVAGSTVLTQTSQGEFDEAGLAPLRFTDKRSRRPAAAANFQRDAGTISFSGPARQYPLRPGSQDRLSWLLQLPAIVAAEPALRHVGSKVSMNVATANGDVAVWVFRCQGPAVTDGAAATLVCRREARGPYDTAVAVTLDPQRGYLPLQASWKSGADDAGYDLSLQEMTPSP